MLMAHSLEFRDPLALDPFMSVDGQMDGFCSRILSRLMLSSRICRDIMQEKYSKNCSSWQSHILFFWDRSGLSIAFLHILICRPDSFINGQRIRAGESFRPVTW